MSKICPRCRNLNRDEAKHCLVCAQVFAPAPAAARLCPAGRHVMDPGWAACPYCGAGQQPSPPAPVMAPGPPRPPVPPAMAPPAGPPAYPGPPALPPQGPRRATVLEGQSQVSEPHPIPGEPPRPSPPPSPLATKAPTLPVPPQSPSSRRKTKFGAPEPASSGKAYETVKSGPFDAQVRRSVAILVTYTWRAEGQVLPVREGRNFIGSDPECEVFLPDDSQLSGRHATIVARGNRFWIDDEKSMNGTFVDGEGVEEKRRLSNYAKVTTGNTVWTFIAFEPEAPEEP